MGRFMVDLGQLGSVHGRVGSVRVGSWSGGRFMVSFCQFRSVWVGSWSSVSLGRFMVGLVSFVRFIVGLGQLGSVHGRFGSVHGRVGSVHRKFGLV